MILRLLLFSIGAQAVVYKEVGLSADVDTLEYVHAVWRHGDRTPAELLFPEDAVKWPDGLGELTSEGAAQQYRLGQWLRRRYGEWLGDTMNRDAIYIRSSDYNRTLMSALANMAGLFPPKVPLADGILWQPIPVHTMPKEADKELYENAECPVAEKEMDAQWKSEKAIGIRREFAAEFAVFEEKLNMPNMELKETWKIFDNLFCEKQHNISWPEWVNASMFSRVDQLYNEVSKLEFHTEKLRRLRGGTLLEDIFKRFSAKANGSLGNAAKFYAYSAHDSTVAALLSTLGFFYEIYPKYATCLLIEMHRHPNNTREIRVFHKNETDVDRLIEYSIPGCEQPCTLQKLSDDLSRYFPDDWDFECGRLPVYKIISITLILVLLCSTITLGTMLFLQSKQRIAYRALPRDDNVQLMEMVDSD